MREREREREEREREKKERELQDASVYSQDNGARWHAQFEQRTYQRKTESRRGPCPLVPLAGDASGRQDCPLSLAASAVAMHLAGFWHLA